MQPVGVNIAKRSEVLLFMPFICTKNVDKERSAQQAQANNVALSLKRDAIGKWFQGYVILGAEELE